MKHLEGVNDFVIRFANVNGSGSASANNLFAKAVFRMGVPVSPKNIFPSNIQGLPTWYEVRVNAQGYVGRRGDVDMVVAVNGQTLRQDYDGLTPGGYFLFDSSKPLPEEFRRDDVTVIGVPMTLLCNEAFDNPKMRPLLKNIIYVGALAALLDMELQVLIDSLTKQFRKNPKLAEPNIQALQLGYDYAGEHFQGVCKLSVQRCNLVGDSIIMDGNTAVALGALYAGATVVGTVAHLSIEEIEWQLGINLWGVIYGTKAFLPMMLAQSDGCIVNISSVFGLVGYPAQGAYNISKFGVRGLTECLWNELEGTGVRAISVHPGGIKTNIEKAGRRCAAAGEEEARFSALADKLLQTSPDECAADIIAGIERGKKRIITGNRSSTLFWLSRLMPNAYPAILKRVAG